MAVTVQSDAGDVAAANSYIDVTAFKAYHDDRGNDYSAAATDVIIGQALIRARDYLDTRFTFIGIRLLTTQTTEWPRMAGSSQALAQTLDNDTFSPFIVVGVPTNDPILLVDPNGATIVGVPQAVKNAQAEYALRAINVGLYQDAPAPAGGRLIDAISNEVDVIKQSITYADMLPGAVVLPAIPQADLMLVRAGLVVPSRIIQR